jgi:formimidoylglutamate deiminase
MASSKLSFRSALLPEGWRDDVVVVFDGGDGVISRIETAPNRAEATPKRTEAATGVAIPAMANVHCHAHQRLMTGLAEKAGPGADTFWTWRVIMYRFALKLGPDDLEAVAAQAYVEMLKAGFSAVGEFQYLHHRPNGQPYDNPAEMSLRCLAAAEEAGIAITMLPSLYRYGGFGAKPPDEGQRRFINDADSYLKILEILKESCTGGLRRLGIAPHSLRAVDAPLIFSVVAALGTALPIHIHVAEQLKEVEDCLQSTGQRPVEYLLNNFAVSNNWCAIHATHMTAAETTRLAASGAIAGLCPMTEANLGDGIFPARQFLDAKGKFGIGTDSNITMSPAEDLRQLEYSQRLATHARNVLAHGPGRSTGRTLLEAALTGGAQALAQPIGQIAPGFRADIVVLDPDHPALIGRAQDDMLDAWIFSGGNACVKDVYVAGSPVITDRHHAREAEIEQRFRAAVKRLEQ